MALYKEYAKEYKRDYKLCKYGFVNGRYSFAKGRDFNLKDVVDAFDNYKK